MTPMRRGMLLLVAQLAIAGLIFGVLASERALHPRVWVRTIPMDPLDPFRGRYVRLWLEATDRRDDPSDSTAVFSVEEGRLVARSARGRRGERVRLREGGAVSTDRPVAFFIPEHVPDPSVAAGGEELWVEVSVLPEGLPRPIRIEHRPARSSPP